jgi:hypothetical protein
MAPYEASGSPEDAWYFNYFRNVVAVELSGGSEERLWNRTVLQYCHFEPAVCQMVSFSIIVA